MNRFLEKLSLQFDVAKLQAQTMEIVQNYKPARNTPQIESWGVISNSSDYLSGFDYYTPFRNGPGDQNPSKADGQKEGAKHFIQDDHIPTQLCTGYYQEVIAALNEQGLHVRRCRLNLLKPLCATSFHKDTTTETYAACLHIPIITHPQARFETPLESHHLVADGHAYLADISQIHRFVNNSYYDRYHLIMGVWDTKQISQHFRWK